MLLAIKHNRAFHWNHAEIRRPSKHKPTTGQKAFGRILIMDSANVSSSCRVSFTNVMNGCISIKMHSLNHTNMCLLEENHRCDDTRMYCIESRTGANQLAEHTHTRTYTHTHTCLRVWLINMSSPRSGTSEGCPQRHSWTNKIQFARLTVQQGRLQSTNPSAG